MAGERELAGGPAATRPGDGPAPRRARPRPGVVLALAAALALLAFAAQVPKYATPDDFVQALFARGDFLGAPGPLMPYSLVTLSAPLSALYRVLPMVPWYPLVLLALTAVSFAAVAWVALGSPLPGPAKASLVASLALCEVMCCVYFTYTVVAFLSFGAGLSLLLADAAFSRPRRARPSWALGYALVLVGFSLRPESGLAALALFCPFAAWVLLRNRNAVTLGLAVGVLATMAACYALGLAAWRTTPGWESYEPTFRAAQAVVDYPRLDAADAARVAPGLSENDLDMLYDFCFVDSDVFDLATFEALASAVDGYGLGTMARAVAERPVFSACALGLVVVVLAAAALVVRSRRMRPPARALALSVPAMLLASLVLVFLRARPKLHVILPLFVVALFAVTVAALAPEGECEPAAAPRPEGGRARLARALPAALVATVAVVVAVVEVAYALPLRRELALGLTGEAARYVSDNPDTDVLFTHTQGVLLNCDALEFESWDYPENAILLGGYEQYTAAWDAMLAARGLTSSDGLLADRLLGAGAVTVGSEAQADMVATYLSEHTGRRVSASLVEELGVGNQSDDLICVWSYSAA